MAYSERKRKFTFAKNYLRGVLFFSAGWQQLLLDYGNILVNLSLDKFSHYTAVKPLYWRRDLPQGPGAAILQLC